MKAIALDEIKLSTGSHDTREDGLCVMEAVAWLAGEKHSDMPQCTSPVLSRYCQVLNDRCPQWVRDALAERIAKLVGTASPELDSARRWIAADYAVRVFAPMALDGQFPEHATLLRSLARVTSGTWINAQKTAAADAAAAATAAAATATAAAAAYAAYAAYAAAHAYAAADVAAAAYAAAAAATAAYAAAHAYAAADVAAAAYAAADAATANRRVWEKALECLDAMLWPVPNAR